MTMLLIYVFVVYVFVCLFHIDTFGAIAVQQSYRRGGYHGRGRGGGRGGNQGGRSGGYQGRGRGGTGGGRYQNNNRPPSAAVAST